MTHLTPTSPQRFMLMMALLLLVALPASYHRAYAVSTSRDELILAVQLTEAQRGQLHDLATSLGLSHASDGEGDCRVLRIGHTADGEGDSKTDAEPATEGTTIGCALARSIGFDVSWQRSIPADWMTNAACYDLWHWLQVTFAACAMSPHNAVTQLSLHNARLNVRRCVCRTELAAACTIQGDDDVQVLCEG